MKKIKLEMIIEQNENDLWTRVTYNDNLITDVGSSVAQLEQNMKGLLYEIEGLDPDTVEFEFKYDT
jgi:hypothetical protein